MANKYYKKHTDVEKAKEKLRQTPPTQQFKRDVGVWHAYLSSDSDSPESRERKDVVKRIFMLLQSQKLGVRATGQSHFQSVGQMNSHQEQHDQMPLASLLSHGGRVLIQVPPVKDPSQQNKLFDWLLGKKHATQKSSVVYKRAVASHSIDIVNGMAVERHLPGGIQAITVASTYLSDFFKDRHWGLDIGLAEPDGPGYEDGGHGHIYFYWQPPTETEPGALMIGCEGAAPGCESYYGAAHTAKAQRAEFSSTGGIKFSNPNFNYSIKPDEHNGFRLELNMKDLATISKISANDFDIEKDLAQPAGTSRKEAAQDPLYKHSFFAKQSEIIADIDPSEDTLSKPKTLTPEESSGPVIDYTTEDLSLKFMQKLNPPLQTIWQIGPPNTMQGNTYRIASKEGEEKFKIHVDKYTTTTPDLDTCTAMIVCFREAHPNELPAITTQTSAAKQVWSQACQTIYGIDMSNQIIAKEEIMPSIEP